MPLSIRFLKLIPLAGALILAGCGYRAPMHASYVPEVRDSSRYSGVRPAYQELAALMEKDVDMLPTQGNTVTLIADGQENWEMLKDEFRKAERAIYVEPYRFRLDTCGTILAEILAEKAAEGLDVRIILDKSANTNDDRAALKGLLSKNAQVNTFHRPAFFLDRHSLAWLRTGTTVSLLSWTERPPSWAAATSRTSISLTGTMSISGSPAPSWPIWPGLTAGTSGSWRPGPRIPTWIRTWPRPPAPTPFPGSRSIST